MTVIQEQISGVKRRYDENEETRPTIAKRQKSLDDVTEEEVVMDVDPSDLDGYPIADLISASLPIWYPELIFLLNYVDAKCTDLRYIHILGAYGEVFLQDVNKLHCLLLKGVPLKCIRCFMGMIHAKTNFLYIYAMVNCILETTAIHLASRFYFRSTEKIESLSLDDKRKLRDDRYEIMRLLIFCGGKIENVDKKGRTVKKWSMMSRDDAQDGSYQYLSIK